MGGFHNAYEQPVFGNELGPEGDIAAHRGRFAVFRAALLRPGHDSESHHVFLPADFGCGPIFQRLRSSAAVRRPDRPALFALMAFRIDGLWKRTQQPCRILASNHSNAVEPSAHLISFASAVAFSGANIGRQ